jgi:hypothetical protein
MTDNPRTHLSDGRQIVTVETGYAYAVPRGATLQLGDTVRVPPPFWDPHGRPRIVKVVRLGTNYLGDLVQCTVFVA